ncbi:MAG: hypothetical protein JWL72_4838 [Ilumatobacteraceae bacterium]|nr:hypothetical protein [Ilumatobacteraceae bacterium]MCU1391500.1 hypothetical protein [Ilumatobacteraceae bacterium]
MDFSKFKPSDWLKAGGGVVMLIAYFLSWWGYSASNQFVSVDYSLSGSDYFFTGTVPWLILVAIGVLTVLAALDIFKLPATMPAPLIFLGASALAFLLVLIRFFSDGVDYVGDTGLSRGAGLYLALLAAIAVVAGSFLGFKESGGDLNDLKDINKLKGQFGGPSGGPGAPPPPPGMQPPPPPPPPGGGGFTPPPPPPPV